MDNNKSTVILALQPFVTRISPRRLIASCIIAIVILSGAIGAWIFFTKPVHAAWYSGSWTYRKTITIKHGAGGVTANQTNYPILVAMTAAQDKTDLHNHALGNGFDILFTSSDGTTKLSSEREKIDGTSGEYEAWVKVPSLSSSVDTVIYMYYGNASSCDQTASACDATNNSTQVWDTNYKGVYHEAETSGTTSTSSTASNNITKKSASSPNPTTLAIVDGGESFAPTTDQMWVPATHTISPGTGAFTWETWVKLTALPGSFAAIWNDNNNPEIYIDSSGHLNFSGTFGTITTTATLSTGQWYYLVVDRTSGGTVTMYINGTADPITDTSNITNPSNTCDLYFGDTANCTGNTTINSINGLRDEDRFSIVARSATSGYMATEYNNISAPYTFYTVGSETTNTPSQIVFSNTALNVTAGTCSALTVQLQTAGGTAVNPSSTTNVLLSSNSPGGSFSTASDCSGATTTLTLTYTTSDSSKTAYYVDTRKSPTTWTITGTQTSGSDTLSAGTQSETITAGTVSKLIVTLPGESFTDGVGNSGTVTTQTEAASFTVTKLSATDAYFNVNTSYSGSKTIDWSGPSNGPDSTVPSYTTSVSFTSGQSTTTLTTTLYKAETVSITATEHTQSYGVASSSLVVIPGSVSAGNSTVTVDPSTVPINTNVLVIITVKDNHLNPIPSIPGSSIVFTGTTSTFTTPRNTTLTDASGITQPYLAWSDVGTKTVVVVASGTTITQQPTVTVTTAAASNTTLKGGTRIRGGTKLQ